VPRHLPGEAAVSSELSPEHHRLLQEIYMSVELPGKDPLKDAQISLNEFVRPASGKKGEEDAKMLTLVELSPEQV
jgi:hypothetical protein